MHHHPSLGGFVLSERQWIYFKFWMHVHHMSEKSHITWQTTNLQRPAQNAADRDKTPDSLRGSERSGVTSLAVTHHQPTGTSQGSCSWKGRDPSDGAMRMAETHNLLYSACEEEIDGQTIPEGLGGTELQVPKAQK